jgi:hypothetical protein
MSKIKSITIIKNPAEKVFSVGDVCSGLEIASIENYSQEFPDGWNNSYIGFTKDRKMVFEALNASVLINYELD